MCHSEKKIMMHVLLLTNLGSTVFNSIRKHNTCVCINAFKPGRFPIAICLPYADVNSTSIGTQRMKSLEFVTWNLHRLGSAIFRSVRSHAGLVTFRMTLNNPPQVRRGDISSWVE